MRYLKLVVRILFYGTTIPIIILFFSFVWMLKDEGPVLGVPYHRPFNVEKWIAYPGGDGQIERYEMSQDLVRHYLTPPMTRTQIIKLLGKPDVTMTRETCTYYLGSDEKVDWHYLGICFDSKGYLKNTQLY